MDITFFQRMKSCLIFAGTFLCSPVLLAQVIPGSDGIGTYSNFSSTISQEAFISQIGYFDGTGNAGTQLKLTQNGNQNTSDIKINGNGNELITSQMGDGNNLKLNITGNSNAYNLSQKGDDNNLVLDKVKSNHINFQVIQVDNGNGLVIHGKNTGDLPALKIEQSGGMKLSIESNAFFIK